MKRAVGYARVSTAVQERDGTSLETQDKEIRLKATERGVQLTGVVFEDHTGTELDERPQLTKLRQMVRNGEVDEIIVWSFDRLARNMAHQGVILYETEQANVDIVSVKENFDDTLEGKLLRQVVAYMAEKEHARIKERTQAGKRRKVEHGIPLFGAEPLYGYQFNATRTAYEVNPETAPVVVQIFTWAAEGVSMRRICINLVERGIKSPRGLTYWHVRTVRSMLLNPAYHGKALALRYQGTNVKTTHGTTYRLMKPVNEEGVPLPDGVIPALISEELWQQAQVPNKDIWYGRVHPTRLLSNGLVVCGVCGHHCYVRYIREYIYYMCDRRFNTPGSPICKVSTQAVPLEDEVWAMVQEQLGDKAHFMDPLFAQLRDAHYELVNAAGLVRETEDKLAEATDTLIALRGTDTESAAAVSWRISTLRENLAKYRLRQEECEQAEAKAADEVEKANTALAQAVADIALDTGDVAARNHLLRLMGVRVTLYPKGTPPLIEMAPWASFGAEPSTRHGFHPETYILKPITFSLTM